MAAGTICVDVDVEGATVMVDGQQATSRCTKAYPTYKTPPIPLTGRPPLPETVQAASMVSVSKPGFQTETQEVWLLTDEPIELKLELQPAMPPI